MNQSPTVEISSGRIRGSSCDGIAHFKGIPYGDTTGGRNRFLVAQPVTPWTGVREATTFGHRAPQASDPSSGLAWREWIRDKQAMAEDCLVLNIYTPSVTDHDRRPVMFYIHGGGFNAGSGAVAGIDGTLMAKKADVVVVTINHRLNVFGHLYLGDAGGEPAVEPAVGPFADAGNNGILDIVAALRWVRENIASFGGDASNVTIFGQSGGASKVAVLMTMPAAKGLFHKAIVQSASSLIRMATAGEAGLCSRALLAELGIRDDNPAALQDVPMEKLLAARVRAIAAAGDNFRPVVDGRALSAHPFHPGAPEAAAEVPMLIGTCETELTFSLGTNPENFSLSQNEAHRRVRIFLGIDDAGASTLMDAYRRSRPAASPSDIMIAIFSDHMYRRNDILAAERKAAQGKAPAYMYLFTWKTPAVGGMLRTPHTLCIPFVFGTIDAAREMLGTGEDRYVLSERVMGAWAAFARTGNPNHKGLPQWKPYSAGERATMIFDNQCKLVNDPNGQDRMALDKFPLYSADAGARRAG